MNRFYAILSKRAHAIGPEDEVRRKALYHQARTQLDRLIGKADPPLSAYQRLIRLQSLETAISEIEAEVMATATPVAPPKRKGAVSRFISRDREKAGTKVPPVRPPEASHPGYTQSTSLPPRQGRRVDDILDDDPEAQLSLGVIAAIIGGLVLLMIIGVVIALDPSSVDILDQNPGQ